MPAPCAGIVTVVTANGTLTTLRRRPDRVRVVNWLAVNEWSLDVWRGADHRTVVIHGIADSSRSFRGWAGGLRGLGIPCRTFDRRNYADSASTGTWRVSDHALDALDVLAAGLETDDGAEDRSGHLVGHSLGGLIAMEAALTGPVRSLVLYEPACPWTPTWHRGHAAEMARIAAMSDSDAMKATWVNERDHHRLRGTVSDLRALYQDLGEIDLDRVRMPVLVVHGTESARHVIDTARWIADRLPDGHLVELAGAGHDAHVTHHDALSSITAEFLEGT